MDRMGIEKIMKKLLLGNEVWSAVGGNGYYLQFHIGKKIKRNKEINNANLSKEARKNFGEYMIGLFCLWRLKQNSKIYLSCEDDSVKDIMPKIKAIEGKCIQKITVSEDFDFSIKFEGNFSLDCMCNKIDGSWVFKDKKKTYLIKDNNVEINNREY